jgi:hypothetical protein
MEARIMRGVVTVLVSVAMAVVLGSCAGSTTGKEAGIGFDAFNTQSKEDKENEDWFGSFYGKQRCVWGSGCGAGSSGSWTDSGTGE